MDNEILDAFDEAIHCIKHLIAFVSEVIESYPDTKTNVHLPFHNAILLRNLEGSSSSAIAAAPKIKAPRDSKGFEGAAVKIRDLMRPCMYGVRHLYMELLERDLPKTLELAGFGEGLMPARSDWFYGFTLPRLKKALEHDLQVLQRERIKWDVVESSTESMSTKNPVHQALTPDERSKRLNGVIVSKRKKLSEVANSCNITSKTLKRAREGKTLYTQSAAYIDAFIRENEK